MEQEQQMVPKAAFDALQEQLVIHIAGHGGPAHRLAGGEGADHP